MSEVSGAAVMAREPEYATIPPEKLLKSAAVKRRMGDISSQTLWRHSRDPKLGFPAPIRINGVRYWEARAIEEFIARQRVGK